MKTIDVIIQLQQKGVNIEFYERPDGGVRVTKINGKSFSKASSKGNTLARQLLKVNPISKKQKEHLKANRKSISKSKLTEREKKRLKEYNKRVKKLNKELKPLSNKTARKRKAKEGTQSLMKALKNNIRHYSGYAYRANVEWFIGVLEATDPNGYAQVISYLKRHINTIQDDALTSCHELFYNKTFTTAQQSKMMLNNLKNSKPDFDFIKDF